MKIITVTSNDYLPHTNLMLESLRVWHAQTPVTVYVLGTHWTDEHARQLSPFNVTIEMLDEPDVSLRGHAIGNPKFPIWKLDVLRRQREPFVLLDGDTLVLHPLDELFDHVETRGWFSVPDVFILADCHWGEVTRFTALAGRIDPSLHAFNTGVLGANPADHADVFERAHEWATRLKHRYHGDQSLLNLAWHQKYHAGPEAGDERMNLRLAKGARIRLDARIVHLAGMEWRKVAPTKIAFHDQLWSAWPRGAKVTLVSETDFWKRSHPHPWQWVNQANQPRYRAFVRQMRQDSASLRDIPWLVVENAWQAYMIDTDVLNRTERFWRENLPVKLRVVPTYHLNPYQREAKRIRRWRNLRSMMPV